ncbi:hypothetical protein CN613_25675 [Bacillus pseudomycoides]|uniref:HK97 gp10 family phage protein n=1 Tax=Bacillus pseudomycoides TaxID=64104 RepID=A0A2A8BZE0_9BACI|nr:HK97 gp10 family phage protein [Bacillus pseudomycoides]PEM65335.1 hypothetical protein CN613_25675 [Bacillus pseudomycoides]
MASFKFNGNAVGKAIERASKEALEDVLNDLVKASSGAAPHDEGTLEKSWSKEISKDGEGFVGTVSYAVRGENGYNYAIKMHEQQYNLGEKSLAKGGGTGMSGANYQVGSHFLTRPLHGEEAAYQKYVAKQVAKVIE